MPFVLRPSAVAVLCVSIGLAAGCAPTPVEPSATLAAGQSGAHEDVGAAPSPTPGGERCRCTSVLSEFDPGVDFPAWNVYPVKNNSQWRVGFRINVTCTGTGQSNQCAVLQIEDGTLTWSVGKQTGKIVGQTKKVTKFHAGTFGDPWQKEYSDALGADYPLNTTEKMSVTLVMSFEIKCLSSDGTAISRRFRVEGSVDAQAAAKGLKPVLSNGTMTLLLE